MRILRTAAGLLLIACSLSLGISASAQSGKATNIKSPDGHLIAVIAPAGKRRDAEEMESRVAILDSNGSHLREHGFTSSDGEHGYGVDGAEWTPDSQYFVFRMRSSGGHSPMFAPIVFWSRRANRFYSLNDYTGDIAFSVVAPDRVTASTWPGMNPATVSLHAVKKKNDVTVLR